MRKIRAGDGIVYGIADPDTLQTVYVGETLGTMTSRLFQHISAATNPRAKGYEGKFMRWVREIVLSHRIPVVYALEFVKSCGNGAKDKRLRVEAEKFWIGRKSQFGAVLLNANRSEVNRLLHSSRSQEERREIVLKGVRSQTSEQRSRKAAKRWVGTTAEQRSDFASHREIEKGPEKRRAAALKAWETKRAKAISR